MNRLSISELTTYSWSLDEDLWRLSELGVGGVGLWRAKLSDFGEERAVELVRETGLAVSSLGWVGGFTGSDGRSPRDSVQDACDAIRLAAELRAECVLLFPGGRAGHTLNHARRMFRTALDEILHVAELNDVTLALEPVHPRCSFGWTVYADWQEHLELVESIDSPRLKLALDFYHFSADRTWIESIDRLLPRIAAVQLGDLREPPGDEPNRCLLGEGVLPLRAWIEKLETAGYRGQYEAELTGADLEPFSSAEILERTVAAFSDLAGDAAGPSPRVEPNSA
jgi:sugar phosphate isomerase/epimerase